MELVATVKLPPSRRNAHRVATYVAVGSGTGSLEIRISPAPGGLERILRYTVREETGPADDGYRTFRLRRFGGDWPAFRVQIDPHRRTAIEDCCWCSAGSIGRWCSHQQSLRALIEEGHLPRTTEEGVK